MIPPRKQLSMFLLYVVQLAALAQAGTRFASHVTVNTPARSFTHGVGDPLPSAAETPQVYKSTRRPSAQPHTRGYPRVRPSVPFNVEEAPRSAPTTTSLWHNNMEIHIPILPASPYKVDSPDPESLWPEGLFLPPFNPQRFGNSRRSDNELDPNDPYLLEGSEAIAAVTRAKYHGELYFHDIPHIESLFANQELRIMNHLKPHVIGSIRHTWPYNRP